MGSPMRQDSPVHSNYIDEEADYFNTPCYDRFFVDNDPFSLKNKILGHKRIIPDKNVLFNKMPEFPSDRFKQRMSMDFAANRGERGPLSLHSKSPPKPKPIKPMPLRI